MTEPLRDRVRKKAVVPKNDVAPVVPDTQHGAWTNCECTFCREARLNDDERIQYTAHEMADAWTLGWKTGYAKGQAKA